MTRWKTSTPTWPEWPERKAREFVVWALWSRKRFVGTLIGFVGVVALALTVAITGVALSVQGAIASAEPTSGPGRPGSGGTTDWSTRDMFGNPTVTATTTLPIPPASAGPEYTARNFATHWLRGAHLTDYSADRKRWVMEITPLMVTGMAYFLRESHQADFPDATITNATTIEEYPGLPRGRRITTFDLSDASILVVMTKQESGTGSPWLVDDYRYKK